MNQLELEKKHAAQDERYDDAKNLKLQIEIIVAKAIAEPMSQNYEYAFDLNARSMISNSYSSN